MKQFSYPFNNQVFTELLLDAKLYFKIEDTALNSISDISTLIKLNFSNINLSSFQQ